MPLRPLGLPVHPVYRLPAQADRAGSDLRVPGPEHPAAPQLHHAGVPRGHRTDGDAAGHPGRLRPPLCGLRDGGAAQLGVEPLSADRAGRHGRAARHRGDRGALGLGPPLGQPRPQDGSLRPRPHARERGNEAEVLQRRLPGAGDLRRDHRGDQPPPPPRAHLRRARQRPAQHDLRARGGDGLQPGDAGGHAPPARRLHPHHRRTRRHGVPDPLRVLRRQPRSAADARGRAAARARPQGADPRAARARDRRQARGRAAGPPGAGRVPSQVLDPLRLRGVRPGRRAARRAARARRPLARLHAEPGDDLRLLRHPLGRTGARRADDRAGGGRPLAAERDLRGAGRLPLRPRGTRAHAGPARADADRARRPARSAARPPGCGSVAVIAPRRVLLPVVGRHLAREFLAAFALSLAAFVVIYVTAEFFDRLDSFLRHDVATGAIARYFVFKLPLVVTQVTPFAVLVGALVGLGLLARQNEFVALRACGVSVWQIAAPLLGLAALISASAFAWNETVVPYSAHRWHEIENLEIKGRGPASVFAGREVWFHGRAGFYNIDRVSPRKQTLWGLAVYQLDADFRLARLIEAESAVWDGARWQLVGARTLEFAAEGVREQGAAPPGFAIPETLEDFRAVSVEPEELSYGMLRRQRHLRAGRRLLLARRGVGRPAPRGAALADGVGGARRSRAGVGAQRASSGRAPG